METFHQYAPNERRDASHRMLEGGGERGEREERGSGGGEVDRGGEQGGGETGNLLYWLWEEPSLRIQLAFCNIKRCK